MDGDMRWKGEKQREREGLDSFFLSVCLDEFLVVLWFTKGLKFLSS